MNGSLYKIRAVVKKSVKLQKEEEQELQVEALQHELPDLLDLSDLPPDKLKWINVLLNLWFNYGGKW